MSREANQFCEVYTCRTTEMQKKGLFSFSLNKNENCKNQLRGLQLPVFRKRVVFQLFTSNSILLMGCLKKNPFRR